MPETPDAIVASWSGQCPICEEDTIFEARNSWFRDHLFCQKCERGSIPRERALMRIIRELAPDWRNLRVHESSPAPRGVSDLLARQCSDYVATQFFPGVAAGSMHHGCRCEDIERQTFADESFDLVVTQDVMEHIFNPELAYKEIFRTLKPGGLYIHTAPIYKERVVSERRASLAPDGKVTHLREPEYHGNPIDPLGSLVTFHYGYDLADLIAAWTMFDVEIRRYNDRTAGIVAEFSEVIVCRKPK